MHIFIIIKHTSSRIKKKNFRKIGKFQMWEHLIRTLKGQKVFIDTDSDYILKKCTKYFPWVKAYKRNKKFIKLEKSQDSSPTLLMIKNFLNKYIKNNNEIIVTTHVTSPFLRIKTIKNAIKKLKNHDSVAAVTKDYNFAWLKKNKKYRPINFNPKKITKTQNLNPVLMSNGAFFIFKKKNFFKI